LNAILLYERLRKIHALTKGREDYPVFHLMRRVLSGLFLGNDSENHFNYWFLPARIVA